LGEAAFAGAVFFARAVFFAGATFFAAVVLCFLAVDFGGAAFLTILLPASLVVVAASWESVFVAIAVTVGGGSTTGSARTGGGTDGAGVCGVAEGRRSNAGACARMPVTVVFIARLKARPASCAAPETIAATVPNRSLTTIHSFSDSTSDHKLAPRNARLVARREPEASKQGG